MAILKTLKTVGMFIAIALVGLAMLALKSIRWAVAIAAAIIIIRFIKRK